MASPCWKGELLRRHPGTSIYICSIRLGSSFTHISQTNIQKSHPAPIFRELFHNNTSNSSKDTMISSRSNSDTKPYTLFTKTESDECNKSKENLWPERFLKSCLTTRAWNALTPRNDFLLLLTLTACLEDVDAKEAEVFKSL